MNKTTAKKISQSGITVGQIKAMLQRAYAAGAASDKRGKLNPNMSRAAAFNIFWKGYANSPDDKIINGLGTLGARNALCEFGEYWEGWRPEAKRKLQPSGEYHHEDAICPSR